MSVRSLLFTVFLFGIVGIASAQDDINLGGNARYGISSFYNIAKPGEVTIQVNVWGNVEKPGRYEVPAGTDLVDLLSYAGGPLRNSKTDQISIIRGLNGPDSKRRQIIVDLDRALVDSSAIPVLGPGDTVYVDYGILIPLRDIVSIISSTLTVALALITLSARL